MSEQLGGNFLVEIRNLAVPFTLLLAQYGLSKTINKKKGDAKADGKGDAKKNTTKSTSKKTTKKNTKV